MEDLNPTTRFSDRADDYVLYRPGYPAAIIPYLEKTIGLHSGFVIADIGSGTGLFAELFLKHGFSVTGVEPNEAMRGAAVKNFHIYKHFTTIHGTAENTGLPDHSADLLTAAQAFHWFNQHSVKPEFNRILKKSGYTLLVWNILQATTPFLQAYSDLKKKYALEIIHPGRANLENIQAFFYPNEVITAQFGNSQWLNEAALKGYLLSFSTVPKPGAVGYENMMADLITLYQQYAVNHLVEMQYTTMVYLARQHDQAIL